MMDVSIVTDVTVEPVDISTVKDFCRIDADYDGENATLLTLQTSARELIEGFLSLSLAPKTIVVQYAGGKLSLPYGPHSEIISVKDTDGNTITDYIVQGLDFKTIDTGASGFTFFYPISGCYPTIECSGGYSGTRINVTVSVGYTTDNMPNVLKLAILRLVDYMYQNRGSVISSLPEDIKRDIKRYSRNSIL